MFTKRFLVVLLAGITIPAIGLLISFWILNDANRALVQVNLPSIDVICSSKFTLRDPEISAACAEYDTIFLLQNASIWSGFLGIIIPLLGLFSVAICGTNRRRLSFVFPPLIRVIVFLLSISVLLQGAILTYSAYIGESYAIERVHYFLIGAIGLGALFAAIKLIVAATQFGKKLQTSVIGKELSATESQKFFAYVTGLADRLGARRPDNIVVGLEPNFFVTSADVGLPGTAEPLKGETLYVSLPLARLLTEIELSSVIGHELGHFRGEDTAYSLKFAPVYSGLAHSIGAVEEEDEEGASGLAKLPALVTLSYVYEAFSHSERTISRDRELRADLAGAEVSSPKALATALVKVSLYAQLWSKVRSDNVDRLNKGKIAKNLSVTFQDTIRFDVGKATAENVFDTLLDTAISHPTDTHPTLSARLQNLEISPSDIDKADLHAPAHSAIELFDRATDIEEELSKLEHQLMVAMGHVDFPEDQEGDTQHLLRAIYILGASMVNVDGIIQPEEVQAAETIGTQLIEGFDPLDFREICRGTVDLPEIEMISGILKDVLDEAHKRAILEYLEAIAHADGNTNRDEENLLASVKENIGLVD